ncbi:n(6)-adenine-specific DNA methyltransferase 2-like family protein [Cooperia oncophora]
MTDSDDDVPTLPPDTLEILRRFQEEQQKIADGMEVVAEDWQLSQFWYSPDTARQLCRELVYAVGGKGRIACISCPTLVQYFPEVEQYDNNMITVTLFEYDTRFAKKFPSEYISYDYRHPLAIPEELKGSYDVVIADPPFLADECLLKTAQTVRLLAKSDARILLCTGTIMEERVRDILNAKSVWLMGEGVL